MNIKPNIFPHIKISIKIREITDTKIILKNIK